MMQGLQNMSETVKSGILQTARKIFFQDIWRLSKNLRFYKFYLFQILVNMPIKRVSIKHLLRKGFLVEKALNTISETDREQCPKVFLTVYTTRSGYMKFPKYCGL